MKSPCVLNTDITAPRQDESEKADPERFPEANHRKTCGRQTELRRRLQRYRCRHATFENQAHIIHEEQS